MRPIAGYKSALYSTKSIFVTMYGLLSIAKQIFYGEFDGRRQKLVRVKVIGE
ncbi:MAG TPA: hypothetical protein VJZ68_03405 [Nitrososphaera sp.]|nr:hypothetical protein [Nitrososphaera sp.]